MSLARKMFELPVKISRVKRDPFPSFEVLCMSLNEIFMGRLYNLNYLTKNLLEVFIHVRVIVIVFGLFLSVGHILNLHHFSVW